MLVDGTVRAFWVLRRDDDGAPLTIHRPGPLPPAAHEAVLAEGRSLRRFLAPGVPGEVRIVD